MMVLVHTGPLRYKEEKRGRRKEEGGRDVTSSVYAVSALAATDCVTPCTATPEYYGIVLLQNNVRKRRNIGSIFPFLKQKTPRTQFRIHKKSEKSKNVCTTIITNCTHYEVLLYAFGTYVEMPSSLSLLLLLLHTIFINSPFLSFHLFRANAHGREGRRRRKASYGQGWVGGVPL